MPPRRIFHIDRCFIDIFNRRPTDFHILAKHFELKFVLETLSSDKILLTASQLTQCPDLNETSGLKKVKKEVLNRDFD